MRRILADKFNTQLRYKLPLLRSGMARGLAAFAVFGFLGFLALTASHAATFATNAEAESGALSGNYGAGDPTSASGGASIKFGGGGGTTTGYPTTPNTVCGTSKLNGPPTAPAGAVTVPAGDNNAFTLSWNSVNFTQAGKTFWFAPGVHTLGTGQYDQINPGDNTVLIGAPGAIIDGQGKNNFAIVAALKGTTTVKNVTISYLTIQNFTPPGDQGAVNQNGGIGWTIKNNTVRKNIPGVGVFVGGNDVIQNNCLVDNGQYGYSVFTDPAQTPDPTAESTLTGGPKNVTLDGNEVAYNNVCNFDGVSPNPVPAAHAPTLPCGTVGYSGCGCDGAGKFWEVDGALIINNYIHDNYSVGIWADTNNNNFTVQNNYFANNDGPGFMYEVSYNALIQNNNFVGNSVLDGSHDPGFPHSAIYISESGGDSRVPNSTGNSVTISGNAFTNNWSGVIVWENANRFCSNGLPTTQCTLVNPSQFTVSSCQSGLANSATNKPTNNPDYFDGCRWKSQNIKVNGNVFNLNMAAISSQCTYANSCGLNGIFSLYGSTGPYTASIVPTNIAFNQGNVFSNNTYNGPWKFWAWSQGNLDEPLSPSVWQAPVTDKCSTSQEQQSGTCNSGFGQDAGSTFQ